MKEIASKVFSDEMIVQKVSEEQYLLLHNGEVVVVFIMRKFIIFHIDIVDTSRASLPWFLRELADFIEEVQKLR